MRLTAEDVRRTLPRAVGVGVRRPTDDVPAIHAAEQVLLGPHAVPHRRLGFALGRAAARDALRDLGQPEAPIGRGAGGEPLWPSGIVGAISHTRGLALAVVGHRTDYVGLGLDVEELARGMSPRAARLVCRPAEMGWTDSGAATDRLMMVFSAKEAIFKALYPIEHVWLGFADAELTWHPERGAFEARVLKSVGAPYSAGMIIEVSCRLIGGLVLSTTHLLEGHPSA